MYVQAEMNLSVEIAVAINCGDRIIALIAPLSVSDCQQMVFGEHIRAELVWIVPGILDFWRIPDRPQADVGRFTFNHGVALQGLGQKMWLDWKEKWKSIHMEIRWASLQRMLLAEILCIGVLSFLSNTSIFLLLKFKYFKENCSVIKKYFVVRTIYDL